MIRRMDRDHTDKYQVRLCHYFIMKHKFHEFVSVFTLNLSRENV